jgi:hypothetical protein
MTMKTIGLIGGMSWESTAEYYRIMNEAVKEKLGGLHSVKCILYSVDFEEIAALQHRGEYLILFNAIKELREQTHYKSPQIYFKIGTTGLGGMGLNLRVLREIAALNLSISLPKHVNYSVGLKPFEPGEGNQISIDLSGKNIKAWQKIIQMYLQHHPAISDKELSAGEIVGLHFKLQDRRRLEEKD